MNENSPITLPELSSESIARIERAVFDEIGDELPRSAAAQPTALRPRRRGWMTALGVAAAFAGGILIAPPLISAVIEDPASSGAADTAVSESAPQSPTSGSLKSADGTFSADGTPLSTTAAKRDIITTADLTILVSDVSEASESISALASKHSGYVESASVGETQRSSRDSEAVRAQRGSISIRVPAAELDEVMTALGDDGEVLKSAISREDVTATAVDLRARVASGQASVKRLTELMSKSGSVADLIAAESALSKRQADLESLQQQLKSLDEQVAMSTISIQLTEQAGAAEADPNGFGDGLLAGWNGLIASLNTLVVALGFLLPWLAVAGVVTLVIWLVRRSRRRRTQSA